jgi:hypothetical protein
MDKSKLRLFHTTREVEMHFDSFLDTVSARRHCVSLRDWGVPGFSSQ